MFSAFTNFLDKLKVPAYRDAVFIGILILILIILGLTTPWSEGFVDFLDKHKGIYLDDIGLSFAVISFFLLLYGIRRNEEKKEIIKKQLVTDIALQKTQDNLQVLLKSSSSIIYNTEAFGCFKILYITENVTPLMGYSKEEYLVPNWWMNYIHPDDQPGVYAELSKLFTIGFVTFDYRFKKKNGDWVWMHTTSQLLYDANGKPTEIVGTWWDITEQKASQEIIRQNNERVQLAFQATRDVIYDWDLITNELWMSDELYRSLGYDKDTTVMSIEWWESKIHAEDHDAIFSDVMNALSEKRNNWSGEYRFCCADGSYKNILDRGFVIYSAEDTPARWIGSMSDITNAKQTEIELRLAKEKAEASVKIKSEFLANMSHEIRTPLNGVIGMTELALETDIDPQQKRYLENIQSSSETLLSLINDILDFSKMDAGKLDLSPVDFSLRDEIPKGLQVLGLKASEKKLELVFCLDRNVPDLYFSDVLRLQQVIVNLAGNAIKFTEKGEVAINCKVQSINKDEAILLFSVSDTGLGISSTKLSAIFEEFTQADNSTTRQNGGTGLGLAISKKLVEMMGGTIWAESEEGKGSSFYFTICMKLQDENNEPRFIPGATLDGKRVLIVEDNKSTREYTLQVITQFRMRGVAVASGEDALAALHKAAEQNDPYALVLLDISLASPMSGFDVAVEMKKDPILKNTEIIVISMSHKASDRERFGQLGITEFFSKPFSQSDLLDSIQKTLICSGANFKKKIITGHKIKIVTPASSGTLKVLLVEDNIINQEVASNMLIRLGHKVIIANNGLEAITAILTENFDIVLMDVQMPKMNGYEATQKIRETEKNIRNHIHIVGLTANAMKGDKEKCLEIGMDDYISKPIRFEDMTKAIQRFMDKTDIAINIKKEKSKDERPLANLAALLENLDGDEEIFEQFMKKIPKHIETSFKKLTEAVTNEGPEEVEFAAHSLRGLCLNLYMHEVTDITLEIEKLAGENKLNEVTLLVSLLENELLKALDYIKEGNVSILEAV